MDARFQLSAELVGHEQDVRSVCVAPNGLVITGSRDTSAIVWEYLASTNEFQILRRLMGHSHYVFAVAALPACDGSPLGRVVSGSRDAAIIVWDIDSGAPVAQHHGHEDAVCALATFADGESFVSGSWDSTARIWRTSGAPPVVLRGHEASVTAVLARPSGEVLTGSADKTVRVWRESVCLAVFPVHTEPVRALRARPGGEGFITVGNDLAMRVWTPTGALERECVGHSNLIYTAVAFSAATRAASGLVGASAGEDQHVLCWSADGSAVESLAHPAAVWDLAETESGDLLVACSDGVVRVWTRSAARVVSPERLVAFDELVAASTVQAGGAPVDVSKLPPVELTATTSGLKDGETKLFARDGVAVAFSWSAASGLWVEIGEVVTSGGARESLNGVLYDHVFVVETDDGVRRKIGFNAGENEYAAAARFVAAEGLDPAHTEQIASFLRANAKTVTLGQRGPGGGALAADGGAGGGAPGPGGLFTGGSRYQPDGAAAARPATQPLRRYAAFPVTAHTFASSVKAIDGMARAIADNNASPELDAAARLSDSELDALRAALDVLREVGRYHASTLTAPQVGALARALAWPPALRFPVVDMLRLVLLHSRGVAALNAPPRAPTFALDSLASSLAREAAGRTRLAALRSAVNLFKADASRAQVLARANELLALVGAALEAGVDAREQAAAGSLLAEFAVEARGAPALARPIVGLALRALATEGTDADAQHRAGIALGTVLVLAPMAARDALVASDGLALLDRVANARSASDALVQVVADVLSEFQLGSR